MPFVKLDCGMINSTIWVDREAREVFITALLMAEPFGTTEPLEQLEVRTSRATGWVVPPGAYGFVPAAGVGIVRAAGVELEKGLQALERLGSPEGDSRNPAWEGRRLVRVDHGYIILNYAAYRERDYTAAERQRRYRENAKRTPTVTAPLRENVTVTRNITHAESRSREQSAEEELRTGISVPSAPHSGQPERAKRKTKATPKISPEAQTVFDHWRSVHGHQAARIDAKRASVINSALALYSADKLCESISGYRHSPHHMGENDRHTVYDDIEIFLRDAKHIDAGLRFNNAPGKALPPRPYLPDGTPNPEVF